MNRKLGCVLFMLVAAGAGCTLNGKPLLRFGAQPALGGGGGGGDGGGATGGGPGAGGAPSSYTWCKHLREDSGQDDAKEALDPETDIERAVPALLQALCYPREGARGKRDALEAMRRTWMQRLAADEHDWATDIVGWGNLPYGDRMGLLTHTVRQRFDTPWSAAGPIEQWTQIRTTTGASTDFSLQPGASYYLADAFPLTEAGRLGFIERCMFVSGVDDKPHPVEWAVCQPDLDALDTGKLAAELRRETARPLADRVALRLALHKVQHHLPKHAAKVRQLIAKDPAYAKLFELARTVRKDWSAAAASRADLLAAVRAMDDARMTGSRKALEGCSDRTWPLFAAAVSKLPAKRFENLRGDASRAQTFFDAALGAILQDPDAYLAANALLACEGTADHLLAHLDEGLSSWSGFRGPRTAALTAIRLAGLAPDKRGETIDIPAVQLPLAIEREQPASGASRGDATGIIATVTPRGDTVRVTFPATSEVQDQCTSRRTTRRISRIDSSGHIHYESVCTAWRPVRVNTTLPPIDVPKRYAAGLAPKRYVSIVAGVPEAVWPKASSPTPLAAFGVLLK